MGAGRRRTGKPFSRHDITIFRLRFAWIDPQQHHLGGILLDDAKGLIHVGHEEILLQYEMIRGKNNDGRIWITSVQMSKGQEQAGTEDTDDGEREGRGKR